MACINRLPDEMLITIADFLQSSTLSRTSSRLLKLLKNRHVTCCLSSAGLSEQLDWLGQLGPKVHTLRIIRRSPKELKSYIEPIFSALHNMPSLRELPLDCAVQCAAGNCPIRGLCGLQDAPHLTQVYLDLHLTNLGDEGAKALSTLRHVKSLTSVHMNLSKNQITHGGAWALAKFRLCPSLQSFVLNLDDNNIADEGAFALGALKELPALTELTLKMARNGIAIAGVRGLTRLMYAPVLRNLTMELDQNYIRDNAAEALAGFYHAPALRSLRLSLSSNDITSAGAKVLASLRQSPTLRSLELDLQHNQITLVGMVSFGKQPAPCQVTVNLRHNDAEGLEQIIQAHLNGRLGCHATV